MKRIKFTGHSNFQKTCLSAVLLLIFIYITTLSKGMDFTTPPDGENINSQLNRESNMGKSGEVIKIGLLLPVSPDKDLLARSAFQGAELAVEQVNETGGYQGKPFKLITRTTDGLWGAGSKASVGFVYEDQVVAIVTSVDGRNAHLAEQVAAKSRIVQVATQASEETLSQAFVPWFFRIVPNDVQQADALVEQIFVKNGYSRVFLINEDNYDCKKGAESFKKIVAKRGYELTGEMVYKSSETGDLIPGLKDNMEVVVVFGSFQSAKPILNRIKNENPSVQIYGALSMTRDGLIGAGYSEGCEGGIFISSRFCFTTPGQSFKDLYLEKYEQMPNPAASYAYDGVNLIVEAVGRAGPDRDKIRDALIDINYSNAATGPIRFDDKGNRIAPVFLIRLIKGHPVILNP